jgi:hypothetical protein
MRTLAVGAVIAGASLALVSGPWATDKTASEPALAVYAAPQPEAAPLSDATLTEVVQRYCVVCHNDPMMTGNVSFQSFDVERAYEKAPTAERMIRKLRAGMMPPPGQPRPGGDTLTMLVETLEAKVDEAARQDLNLGERRFTRLTREEYSRVVRDLLALDVDAAQWLPPDVFVGTFDNTANGQALNTTVLDAFLRAASEVSRLAIGNPSAATVSTKYTNKAEVSQHAWDRLEGAPFGTRGGIVVTHNFPVDGEYVFEVTTLYGDRMFEEDLDISIDGEPAALVMLEHAGSNVVNTIKTEPVHVKAGQHRVSAAFVSKIDGMYEDRFAAPRWSSSGNQGGQYGITGLTHLREFMVTGPFNPSGVSDTPSRERIFSCRPTQASQQRACAERIMRDLAPKFYRRPVTDDDVADLMRFYDEGAATDGFEIGVRTALQAILAAPEFIFRFEHEPEGVQPGQDYRLSDLDYATRLAFFLWGSTPDQELLDLAAQGRLSDDRVLEEQVRRMLKDPRSEALSTRFVHLWLRLQDVGKVWPEAYIFPDFSRQLAEAMVKETEMLFNDIVQNDLSPLRLFDANYTFINERLAQHYGIDGVFGEEFRKVQYPAGSPRIGIFGHGSILHLTSMADRTSPVLRGKYMMDVLMGTPPPPPPPNVPAFSASPAATGTRRLTTRERMEQHRKQPVCNSCHSFIDPIGLALDNFDATGRWRIRENMAPLDTRGMYYDGTAISTPSELSAVMLKRPIPLVRNFMNRLMAYAIGRPIEYFDQPTIRAITRAAEPSGYKMSSLILGVVKSEPFRMRQAQTTAN